MRRALGIAAAALVLPAPAAAGEFAGAPAEVVGETTRVARVSAYGGAVAWNRYRRGGHELVVRAPGRRPRALRRVRSRRSAIEFDLGPAPGGGVALVYTRCRVRLRGCDAYMQRLGEWRERPLPGVNTRRFGEMRPTIWGDRVAFLRIADGGRRRSAPFIRIYTRRLSRRGRSRLLPGGPHGSLPAHSGFGLEGLDLGPRGVVFTWVSRDFGSRHYRVLFDGLRGGQRLVAEVRGSTHDLHSASLSGDTVSWLEYAFADPGPELFTLRSLDLRSGARSSSALPCATQAASRDRGRFAFIHTAAGCDGRPEFPARYRVIYGPAPPSSSP